MLARKNGKIIIGSGANVWPHELETAKVLAKSGHDIEFLRASSMTRNYNADVYFDGEKWEIKSPREIEKLIFINRKRIVKRIK